jgi:hypothetical protein
VTVEEAARQIADIKRGETTKRFRERLNIDVPPGYKFGFTIVCTNCGSATCSIWNKYGTDNCGEPTQTYVIKCSECKQSIEY